MELTIEKRFQLLHEYANNQLPTSLCIKHDFIVRDMYRYENLNQEMLTHMLVFNSPRNGLSDNHGWGEPNAIRGDYNFNKLQFRFLNRDRNCVVSFAEFISNYAYFNERNRITNPRYFFPK